MVLSPENDKVRDQALTAALKALLFAVEQELGPASAPERIDSLVRAVQVLNDL